MWFTVLGVFICVVASNGYSCPSLLNQCTTPNGTQGHCTQLKHCPPLSQIVNRTNEIIHTFVTQSICGYDVDKSYLYCCDINQLVVPLPASPCSSNDEKSSRSNTTPKIPPSELYASQGNKLANGYEDVIKGPRTSICQTPNGEVAQCISIFKCSNLLAAAMNSSNWNSKRFLRESKCGYEDGTFFVCCGSDVNFKNLNNAQYSNFEASPLVPLDVCGKEVALDTNQQTNSGVSLANRIFGGTNSEINEFPWVALLQYENFATGKQTFRCGGSLISYRYVLTAAHCVTVNNIDRIIGVRLGAWNYTNLGKSCDQRAFGNACVDPAIDVGVERIIIHPQYIPKTKERYNDIALIRLRSDVKSDGHIHPICLPKFSDHTESGSRLTITGWGLKNYNEQSEIKQKVDVPVIPVSQCSKLFLNDYAVNDGSNHILGQGQFCAGGETGKDACVGDSGSPAMELLNSTQIGPRWYLTGIISFGIGCGLTDRYGVYTKVSEYINWIHQNVVA